VSDSHARWSHVEGWKLADVKGWLIASYCDCEPSDKTPKINVFTYTEDIE
jgi:hypothetical protein